MRILHQTRTLLLPVLGGSVMGDGNTGCGPECAGQCFGGTCLFTDSLDDDLFSVPDTKSQPSSVAATLPSPRASSQQELPDGNWPKQASAEYGFAARESILARSPVQTQPSTLSENPGPLALRAPAGLPPLSLAGLLQDGRGTSAGLALGPSGAGLLGASGERDVLALRVQSLKDELKRAQAEENQLTSVNSQLRNEVEKWRVVGARVAEREAKAVEMLENNVPTVVPQATADVNQSAAMTSQTHSLIAVGKYVSGLTNAVPYGSANHHLLQVAGLVLAFCFLILVWLFQKESCTKGHFDYIGAVEQLAGSSGSLRCVTPMLRYVGVSHYKVEVSEIHLGSLLGGGDVQVSLQIGDGDEMCTEVLRRVDGSFLRFHDSFILDVRKTGQPLVLIVIDGRGKLARLEIAARDLIRLAQREHAEYYRAELSLEDALRRDLQRTTSDKRPYAAMRVRDVTSRALEAPAPSYGSTA